MYHRYLFARVMAALLAVTSVLGSAAPIGAATAVGAPGRALGNGETGSTAASLSDFGQPFHFLQPLAPDAGDATKFDVSLLKELVVSICRVGTAGCTVVKTITSTSALAEQLRVMSAGGIQSFYQANWDTSGFKLTPSTFRITVTVDRLKLGSVDVTASQYKSFPRTWPIKFRIEKNPVIRVRVLHEAGKSAGQIANAIKQEFGLGSDDIRYLLAHDLDPFSDHDIDIAINGVFQDVVMPATTKIADAATGDALTSFDTSTGQMTFGSTTQLLANLKVGDVLAGEPTANAPYGYLRRVTTITKNKKTGTVLLGTTQARIDEAISKGTLDAEGTLKPSDVIGVTTAAGVRETRAPATTAQLNDVGDSFDFHDSIDLTLDQATAGDGVTGDGVVHIRGRVDFNAGYNVGVGVEPCLRVPPVCVDRFEAHFGGTMSSSLHVDGTFNGTLHKETVLSRHFFKPIVLMIGPFPFVLVPVVKAIAGIDGDAHAEFSFDAQASDNMDISAKWTDPDDGGDDWHEGAKLPDPTGTATGDFSATMHLHSYAGTTAELLVYGVAGPGFKGTLGADARVQFPNNPLWSIWGLARGRVEVSVDFGAVFKVRSFGADLPEGKFRLGAAANLPPDCSATKAQIPAEPGVATVLGPRTGNSLQGYFACADPEGEGDPTYTATANGNTVLVGHAVFDTVGTYVVHVTASDVHGASTTFDLTVDVQESAPILSLATASASVPAGTQYWVTASAFQPSTQSTSQTGDFLDCSLITWDAPGATVTPYASHRICTALIVFAASGPHTVTVTATNQSNKSDLKILTVNVSPAPANAAPELSFGTFHVTSATGPSETCSDLVCADVCSRGVGCEVPMDALLFNGSVGNYHGPLSFWLHASDLNGEHVTVTWHCVVGSYSYAIADNDDGSKGCDPYSPTITEPILVWADISDGTTTIHSEIRRMFMLDRVA